jgi:hypothetical protein
MTSIVFQHSHPFILLLPWLYSSDALSGKFSRMFRKPFIVNSISMTGNKYVLILPGSQIYVGLIEKQFNMYFSLVPFFDIIVPPVVVREYAGSVYL